MKTKLMIALFSTVLLGACQNSQMGMDTKDMKETTEMMSSMSGEKMDKMDNMSSKDEKMDNMSSKDEKMDKKMGEMDDMTWIFFSSFSAVSRMMGMCEVSISFLMAAHNSSPRISGIMISEIISSGMYSFTIVSASLPLEHV